MPLWRMGLASKYYGVINYTVSVFHIQLQNTWWKKKNVSELMTQRQKMCLLKTDSVQQVP